MSSSEQLVEQLGNVAAYLLRFVTLCCLYAICVTPEQRFDLVASSLYVNFPRNMGVCRTRLSNSVDAQF